MVERRNSNPESHDVRAFDEDQVRSDLNRLLSIPLVLYLGWMIADNLYFFGPGPGAIALRLLLYAALILSVQRWTGAILFVLVAVPLFTMRFHWGNQTPTIYDLTLVFQVILMLAIVSRMNSPAGHSGNIRGTISLLFSQTVDEKIKREQTLQFAVKVARDFVLSTLLLTISLLAVLSLSVYLLQCFPLSPEFTRFAKVRYQLLAPALRLICLGGLMFVSVLLCWIVITEVNFRRLSAREASMYVRGQMFAWLYRDFRAVVRRQKPKKRIKKKG